jgi:AcrR family transcriptional regulator
MPEPTSKITGRPGPPATKHLDIVSAASRLFARKGVAQTTTREIAAEAQTTERTLFKHFGSKEFLVQAVIAESVVANLAPVSLAALSEAIKAHAGDLRAWHVSLLSARADATSAAPELTRLLLVEILRDEQLREAFARTWLSAVWEPLTGLFERLQTEGRIRSDMTPETVCRAFLSLNIGFLISRYVLAPSLTWDNKNEIESIATVFLRGITSDSKD